MQFSGVLHKLVMKSNLIHQLMSTYDPFCLLNKQTGCTAYDSENLKLILPVAVNQT